MIFQVGFSQDAFVHLIKYRFADLFRPPTTQVKNLDGDPRWLDGIVVTEVVVTRIPNDRGVALNELRSDGSVAPNPQNAGFGASAIALNVGAVAYLTKPEDVKNAGTSIPVPETQGLPKEFIRIVVRIDLGADGIPMLSMQLETAALPSSLDPAVVAKLASAANASIPFDVVALVKDLLPGGQAKILNVGLTLDPDGALVIRFEIADSYYRYPVERVPEWREFSDVDPKADLGGKDWSVGLDGNAVAALMANRIDPLLKDSHPVYFSGAASGGFSDGTPPRVTITKPGYVENACAGNDVRFDGYVNVDFSVPTENELRASLAFDYTKNAGDAAKCIFLSLVNPFFWQITLFDNGLPGIGLGAIALNLVFPVQPVLASALVWLLIVGVDASLVKDMIDDKLKKQPTLTKVGDGYVIDKDVQLSNKLTRDWLALTEAAGGHGRLLLRGELRIPRPVLPQVRASDLEGFSAWRAKDRCNSGEGKLTQASVDLTLGPGYYDDTEPKARVSNVPLKYGIDSSNNTVIYEVLDDPLGVYQIPQNLYWQIDYQGIPGKLVATIHQQSLWNDKYKPFRDNPYPLRLRLYTNGGIREYQFSAPPVFVQHEETVAETAERINRCKQLGASLILRKYLEMKWLVDPGPDRTHAQEWSIHLQGLQVGQRVQVWHGETGQRLMEGFVPAGGRLDTAFVLDSEAASGSLLVGLGHADFQHISHLRREHAEPAPEGFAIAMSQASLKELDSMDLEAPADRVEIEHDGDRPTIKLWSGDRETRHFVHEPQILAFASRAREAGDGVRLPGRPMGILAWRGGERRFMQISHASGRPEVIAEYSGRSLQDASATCGSLFLQASEDGRSLKFYRRGTPMVIAGLQWQEEPEPTRA